jgi:hypothetical protein
MVWDRTWGGLPSRAGRMARLHLRGSSSTWLLPASFSRLGPGTPSTPAARSAFRTSDPGIGGSADTITASGLWVGAVLMSGYVRPLLRPRALFLPRAFFG